MFVPVSTYRVQLHKGFTFRDLSNILDYLQELGVHTIYAAPIFTSTPGSMHGYDVVDPHTIDPEIGTLDELRQLREDLGRRNMAWIQDIVPNHMAFSSLNKRLMDVLERGERSPYYDYFDINWNHPDPLLSGKVMIPFLGKPFEECLTGGEIKIHFSSHAGFTVSYYDNEYPLSVLCYDLLADLMKDGPVSVKSSLRAYGEKALQDVTLADWLAFKKTFFGSLPPEDEEALSELAKTINSDEKAIRELMERQFYRLVYWKETEHVINYRRFFTVNSLICLRMESEKVFHEYHRFIASLYEEGLIQGVRIDHIDGLNDPSGYLKKIRQLLGDDCYIIAEKILEANEDVPENWPLEGTSGYKFLYYVNQLFTDRRGSNRLVDFYRSVLPGMPDYEEIVLLNKKLILNGHMAGELENLVTFFFELNMEGDFTRERIREALSLFMLSLPVYRIYPDRLPLKDVNLELISEAFSKARQLNPDFHPELEHLMGLCTANPTAVDAPSERAIIRFLRRLMQFTGPLTAKGVEDTTFYIYNPLISHVEVGDTPSTLGISIGEFHQSMIRRRQSTPLSLNATATHDTKRGEDARVRLNAISEVPEEWIKNVTEWMRINGSFKTPVSDKSAPILNDEYFIYQSILGGFPEDGEVNDSWVARLKEYMVKVVREAKVMSDWSAPNQNYEDACGAFIDAILKPGTDFLTGFTGMFGRIQHLADSYSVAQTVIKMTAPGIPDIYQGCELPDYSYVDPDNRRPVDYKLRKDLLLEMQRAEKQSNEVLWNLLEEKRVLGASKMFATYRCLQLRNQLPRLFSEGAYLPLALTGEGSPALAYARYLGEFWCITVIPLGLGIKNKVDTSNFSDIFISLPANSPTAWRNIFTNEPIVTADQRIALKELNTAFPVAVLCNYQA